MEKPVINMKRKKYKKDLEMSNHSHTGYNIPKKDGYRHNIVEKDETFSSKNFQINIVLFPLQTSSES